MRAPRFIRARKRIRPNLLGLIAVFIALGGTAVALPGKNRVDSGDIKQGQVKTLDLRRGAVTKSKLRRNAVDGSRVRNNTLTADDIDESTLGLPLGQGVVGEQKLADRERRIVFSAGELVPATDGNPTIALSFGIPAAFFAPSEDDVVGAISQVPLDRAPGSGLQVRLLWDANGVGEAVWAVDRRTPVAGSQLGGVTVGQPVSATSPGSHEVVETIALEIPAAAVLNGEPLSLTIRRDGDAAADTLPVQALLRLVEIRYVATG